MEISGRWSASRRVAAALVPLALAVTGLGVVSTPAHAVDGEQRVRLPRTGVEPTVVAASGTALVVASGEEGSEDYALYDPGRSELTAADFRAERVRYTGKGVVYYTGEPDADAQGDYLPLLRYDLVQKQNLATLRIRADRLAAVGPTAAVVASATGYTAQLHADGTTRALALPVRTGTSRLSLNDTDLLRTTPARSLSGRLGTGRLELAPLSGAAARSLRVAGLVTAGLRDTQLVYVTGTSTSARLCYRLTAASATPACVTLKSGDYAKATAELALGRNWALVTLAKAAGRSPVQFVVTGKAKPGSPTRVSRTSAMHSLTLLGSGDSDWPLGLMVDASGGWIVRYDLATKAVAKLAGFPQEPVRVAALQLTADRVWALDDAPARALPGSRAWSRTVGDEFGGEEQLPVRARQLSASAARTLVAAPEGGVTLFEPGRSARKLPSATNLLASSGPYYLTEFAGTRAVRRVDGAWLDGGSDIVALFGSRVVRQKGTAVTISDVTDPTVQLSRQLPVGVNVTAMWGDWLLGERGSEPATVVVSPTGAVFSHAGAPQALGDGFVVLALPDDVLGHSRLAVWNYRSDALVTLDDSWRPGEDTVATDGVHRLAYTTASDLVLVALDDLETADSQIIAPRALGVLAPVLFHNTATSAAWRFELDATKALATAGGRLDIDIGRGEPVRLYPDDLDGDGSIRLTWNGRDPGGAVVPPGSYRWTFEAPARDNSTQWVRPIGGAGPITGTVKVVGVAPAAVTGATPRLDRGSPRVGQVVTVTPGAWKASGQPVRFGFQWYRGRKAILGASGPTYRVTRADRGARLRVKVTGMADGRPATSKYSSYTSSVR